MHPKYMLFDSFDDEKQLLVNCEKKLEYCLLGILQIFITIIWILFIIDLDYE